MANEAWQSAFVEVVPDFSNFRSTANREMSSILGGAGDSAGIDSSSRFGSSFTGGIGKLAAPIAGAIAALGIGNLIGDAIQTGVNFGVDSVKAGSDLNESANAVKVTFGEAADEIDRLGSGAASRIGLSANDFNGIATQFSSFAGTIAGNGGDITSVIDDLTTRGADFASVYNLDVGDALGLFQSGLAGESEPLRQYGIDLSAASVSAYAYANGIAEQGSQLTEAQRIQASYGSILEQTENTQGDFSNTSGELANSQRIMAAEFENTKASLGTALLPALTQLMDIARTDLLPVFQDVIEKVGPELGTALADAAPAIGDMILAIIPLIPQMIQLGTDLLPIIVDLLTLLAPLFVDGATNLSSLVAVFSGLFGLLTGDVSLEEVTATFMGLGGSVFEVARAVATFIGEAIANFANFAFEVGVKVGEAASFITGLPGRAVEALGNVGQTLFNSGQSLIQGFIDGIEGAIGGVGDAVGGVMDFVGGFFPNSPAQRGQFAGSGWTRLLNSGEAIGAQFGAGLDRATSSLSIGNVAIPNAAGTVAAVTGTSAAMAAAAASRAPIAVTVNGAPGQSAETVGRVVVDGLNFTQRVAG